MLSILLNMVNLVSNFLMLRRYLLFLILSELVKLIIKHPVLYFWTSPKKYMSLVSKAQSCKVTNMRLSVACRIFQYSRLCVIQKEHKHPLRCLQRKSLLILSYAFLSANFHHSTWRIINIKILFVPVMPSWRNSVFFSGFQPGLNSWNTPREGTAV